MSNGYELLELECKVEAAPSSLLLEQSECMIRSFVEAIPLLLSSNHRKV